MKIITIAGIPRSGNVWTFNAVRILLEDDGAEVTWSGYREFNPQDDESNRRIHIIAEHDWFYGLEEITDLTIVPIRRVVECERSWIRFRGQKPDLMPTWLESRDRWLRSSKLGLVLDFTMIDSHPYEAWTTVLRALRTAGYLRRSPSVSLYQSLKNLKPPKKGQDPTSLLWHNHITR
jgi:hypothetical protein